MKGMTFGDKRRDEQLAVAAVGVSHDPVGQTAYISLAQLVRLYFLVVNASRAGDTHKSRCLSSFIVSRALTAHSSIGPIYANACLCVCI